MEFDAEIKLNGINPYVLVSAERAQEIRPGWRRPMPVVVQLNGRPDPAWRINMIPVGDGSFYLYLDGALRKQADARLGDRVAVSIRFDPTYKMGPQHGMLPAFAAGLESSPDVKKRWGSACAEPSEGSAPLHGQPEVRRGEAEEYRTRPSCSRRGKRALPG